MMFRRRRTRSALLFLIDDLRRQVAEAEMRELRSDRMTLDLEEMRHKWERYGERLKEGDGDGSLVGASYIIATLAATDIPLLLDELKRLQEIERCAAGVVRTAHPAKIDAAIVAGWWQHLRQALGLMPS